MDVNVIKSWLVVGMVIILSSCVNSNIYNIKEIDSISLIPRQSTYSIEINITGNFECENSINLLHAGNLVKTFKLQGPVNETYKSDWFMGKVQFSLNNKTCLPSDAMISVKLNSLLY